MKRSVAVLTMLLMATACCACVSHMQTPPESVTAAPTSSAEADEMGFNFETDFNNRFGGQQVSLTETEDAYYWYVPMSHYIRYYDKKSGEEGVLCGRPECWHDSAEQNADCSGYVADMAPGLSYYKGKLYFVAFDDGSKCYCLFCMSPDGTSRERIKKLDWDSELNLQECCVHRGRLFVSAYKQKVTSGAPSNTMLILSTAVERDDGINVLWSEDFETFATSCKMRFIGRYVYFMVSHLSDEEKGRADVYRWDTEGNTLGSVGGCDSESGLMANFWVERDGTCWLSCSYAEPDATLVRIENGIEKDMLTLCGENEEAHSIMMGDGVLIRLFRSNNSDIDELQITDFEGNTVFSGKPPLNLFDEYKNKQGFSFTPGGVWGDKHTVIFTFHPFLLDEQTQDIWQGSLHTRLVRFDITENGLIETQLGVDAWR